MEDIVAGTAFAHAYREAEARKAEAEAEALRLAREAEAEATAQRVYDPTPYSMRMDWDQTRDRWVVVTRREQALPAGDDLYVGTGIGALYGVSGCERFLPELAGWTIGREQ